MRARHLTAVVALALSCALFAISCAQSPESPPETDPGEAQSSNGAEPTGEAQQAVGSKVFRFIVDVDDDGKDKAGGWQKATATLHFVILDLGIPTHHFQCPLVVGMPIRSEREGRISPSRAAFITAEIETEVADAMAARRDWRGQGAVFCIELVNGMRQMFRSRYPGVGATVSST